jgi:hypothetical protein
MKLTRARLILIVMLATLLAAYTLFGFFGVPRLVRSQATDFVAVNYGRKLDLGEIRFNPFTLVLRIRDLSFPDAEGHALVGFRALLVDLNASSLFRLAPSFAAIELEQPFTGVIVRKDGSVNLADFARPFAAEPAQATSREPLRVSIDRLRVLAGRIDFEDRTRPSVFRTRLAPITFELRDFATTGAAGNAYSLRAASANDERFAWDGAFATTPFTSSGQFSVANLRATTLWSYLGDALPFELTRGLIDLDGGYEFVASESGLKLKVKNVGVAELALRARGQAQDDVTLARLDITNTLFDLRRRRIDVEKLRLTGAAVRARRDAQGAVNLLALLGPDAPPAAPAAPARPAPAAWVMNAPDISIDGSIDVEDALVTPAAVFKLAPVAVKLGGYSNAPGTRVQIDAHVGIDGSAKLAAKGEVVPDTSAVAVHVDLSDFKLPSIQPYLGAYTQMTLSSGTLSAGLDLRLAEQGASVVGNVEVAKLHTIDNALRQEFVSFDRLRVAGIDYTSAPAKLRIATITANSPYARLIIAPDQSTNISKILSASGQAPSPVQTLKIEGKAQAPNPAPLHVSIGTVRVINGAANFADFWIQPNYAVNLQNMNGSIVGLSPDPKSRARVDFEGTVDKYAPARISGELNLLSAALYTDLKVAFKGVEMTSVTPYSGRFAGYKIEKGKLSIDVSYFVENRTLAARQKFVIDQLELGERVESEDAVRLPLKLAVALLKDRNGVIDIDLPMSGSLDDPQFRMGPLVWKAFVGLLTKAATAPFALLGSLFGGGEEMNLIEFDAGTSALDAAAKERLASISKALTERPALQLEVPTTYSPDLDRAALAQRKLEGLLRSLPKSTEAALADPAQRFELLVAQYHSDYGAKTPLPTSALAISTIRKSDRDPAGIAAANAEMQQAIAQRHKVEDTDLEQLAQMRARAIQEALLGSGTLEAARVFVMGVNPSTPSENRKVRVELSLK